MRRRAQFSIHTELTRLQIASDVRARTSDVCAENFKQQHETVPPLIPTVLNARLVRSGSPYIES